MKMIRDLTELKKGDTVIVKDNVFFETRGFSRVTGDVYSIDRANPKFTIKCNETASIEEVSLKSAKIFLIN